jgi:hypothetical protein
MLILIIVLVLVLGGGGGFYGHSRWGYGGGAGIGLGTILLIGEPGATCSEPTRSGRIENNENRKDVRWTTRARTAVRMWVADVRPLKMVSIAVRTAKH